MSDEIKEFSRDEVSSTIFHGAPSQVAPAQQSAAAFTPVPPAVPVPPSSLARPTKGKASVAIPDPTQLVEKVSKASKALKEDAPPPEPPSAIGGLVDQILNNWKPIAATAATTYAVTKAAPIISRGIGSAYNKVMTKRSEGVPESKRIDPVFATEQEMAQAANAPKQVNPAPIQQTNLTPEEVKARADQLKASQAPTPGAPIVPPQFYPAAAMGGSGVMPPAPPYMPSTPLSSAPDDAPAPKPSSGPGSFATTTIVDEVKDMIQKTPDPVTGVTAQPASVAPPQELRTGTGKPAFAGMGPEAALNKKGEPKFKPDYGSINDVPSGYAFVPGAQYIDPARQDMGQAPFTETFKTRDYPLTDQMARQQAAEVNRMLNRPTRAELKAAGLEPAPNTPGITKKTSAGTKPVRVAGTLGALIAIPDLAKAETPGQRGLAGASLLEAILPPGFMMGGAGEGSSTVPSADAAMLLGSPYAQSELAKKRRQALEYAAKVGGGRGLTPASAYQR